MPAVSDKCKSCRYDGRPIGELCVNGFRMTTTRFPIVHRFMKKDEGGWLALPYDTTGRCKFYASRGVDGSYSWAVGTKGRSAIVEEADKCQQPV